jgi:hypothetical protein
VKFLLDENLSPKLVRHIAKMFPGSKHVHLVGADGAADRPATRLSLCGLLQPRADPTSDVATARVGRRSARFQHGRRRRERHRRSSSSRKRSPMRLAEATCEPLLPRSPGPGARNRHCRAEHADPPVLSGTRPASSRLAQAVLARSQRTVKTSVAESDCRQPSTTDFSRARRSAE